jgi:radical SAM superfamily enzyme YgiQ (UPF0313 family)
MKKKVVLIQAAQMEGGKVKKVEKSYIVSRTMPYLAALFSKYSHGDWEIVLIDDYLKGESPFNETADLYAITAMAATLDRAIQIGEILKRKNPKIPVIIGGPGPTASLDKINELAWFNSIFVGEAEITLRQFIEDFERGAVKKVYCSDRGLLQEPGIIIPEDSIYYAEQKPDLIGLPVPRYDLLNLQRYTNPPWGLRGLLQSNYRAPQIPIEFGRGCPHHCEFCTVYKFWGPRMRRRPVAEVIDELRQYPSKAYMVITDDNLVAIEKETIKLLKEIIRVKETEGYEWKFFGQFSTLATRNEELIELAGRAGFASAFLGLESIEPESLCLTGKEFNLGTVNHDFLETLRNLGLTKEQIKEASQKGIQVIALRRQGISDNIIKECIKENYRRVFNKFTAAGINPYASLIYGFDGDTIQTIRETTDFLIDAKVPVSYQWILTPLPGSRLAKRLEQEKRLYLPFDFSKSDSCYVLFEPKKMSREELEREFWASYHKFYSISSIIRRVVANPIVFRRPSYLGLLYNNLLYRSAVKNNIQPLSVGYRWCLEAPEEKGEQKSEGFLQ